LWSSFHILLQKLLLQASPNRHDPRPARLLWRYVSFVKKFCIFLFAFLVVLGAGAQPDVGRKTIAFGTAHEQQRAELRSALRTPHEPEMQETGQASKTVLRKSPGPHLSAQERSDLRLQLRQQHSAVITGTPGKQN
jgi:hypothetical protein